MRRVRANEGGPGIFAALARQAWCYALRHAAVSATLSALALLFLLQAWTLWRAPPAWYPSAVTVTLRPGEEVVLGSRELAAPQADQRHLALRRDADGAWQVRNLSPGRQLILQDGAREHRLGSTPLQAGQRFQVDTHVFDVSGADGSAVSFTQGGHQWRYDGATVYRDGRAQDSCPDAGLAARLLAGWNRWVASPIAVSRPLSVGGNLYCGNRLGLPMVTPGAAQISRSDGAFQLLAGNPDGERAAVLARGADGALDLRRQEAPLAGVAAIVAGHTRLQLAARDGQISLAPSRHVALYAQPDQPLPPQVAWQWRQRGLWQAGQDGALWAGLALCGAALLAVRARNHAGWPLVWGALACVLLLACGTAALLLQRGGHPPAAACSLALGAAALLLWMLLPGRLALPCAAAVVLLAAGLLSQLELGLGAPESSWLRYYQKSCALLAIGCAVGGLARMGAMHHVRRRLPPRQRATEWLLAALAAVALAALAAQVLWGDETGVFDLQPVELAKLALTALSAHCLALRFGWHAQPAPLRTSWRDHGARWLRLAAPALLFLALLGLALVQVDDFSPLVLLMVWSAGMACAYALAARRPLLLAAVCLAGLAAVAALAWLRLQNGDELVRWGFYADRFQVWLDPGRHPHTGQQLLLGARAVAEGGWLGADHWLGLRTLGQAAADAVRIPAVQDDFAASFFLYRHGLAGGLLLWMLQAAFLAGLLLEARRAHAGAAAARHFHRAWSARLRYFALCGGAAFVLGHFLLSWGTNLAIFPIMGQPMSFLSAGGSHLLFFLCPLLALGAVSTQSPEE
ncbi:FtsW/RodA/SpoVE family cell cycle protein [Oxalobacteraceae bacterium A2-2]